MSELGIFRKVEMDEKPPQLVYTSTQTSSGEASTESCPGDVPLFLCPAARIRFLKLKLKECDGGGDPYDLHPINSSPYLGSTDCDHHKICKLPVVPLFWCNNENPNEIEFSCGACLRSVFCSSYYTCLECEEKFHKECVESPLKIKYPSHPFHSFQLCSYPAFVRCISCSDTSYTALIYHCNTCNASIHPICAMRSIPFVINHQKSHPHPLTFFPTQASLVCSICAKVNKLDPTYICIECVFVIHRDCIGFPHVIRISRHLHRLTFTLSLPSGKLSCGVCHQQVDNNYGAYSCTKGDAYFVHSKCALDGKVWDGKDLDGVPEEDDMIDDGEPFERIAEGIILHPFHSHQLRLKMSRAYDDKEYCRGCSLPIYQGQFYSCMECDFILHQSCANAPRMKRHPLHPHPLTLRNSVDTKCVFWCWACSRLGTGFFYQHRIGGRRFRLDLRCASITEPFEYQGHEHPLFLALDPKKMAPCHMCKYQSSDSKLNCMECNYIICFRCATFPYKVRYKYDRHFLTVCDGKEESDQLDWCDVCEGKIEEVKETELPIIRPKERKFYTCNDCCTTIHVECLLGRDIYMQPGNHIYRRFFDAEIRILLNNSVSRPICDTCRLRCPFPIIVESKDKIVCSLRCIKTER